MSTNIEKNWNVEIKKVAASSRIEVWVNGEHWATGYKESRGPHGYYYTFNDSQQHGLHTPGRQRKTEHSLQRIWSDKHAASQTKEPIAPIEERIKQFIVGMIVAGELSSPEVLKRQAAARRAEREEADRKEQEAIDKAFDDRAHEVLSASELDQWGQFEMSEEAKAFLRPRIVEAMKWAQTR